jgi:hypothetical protein
MLRYHKKVYLDPKDLDRLKTWTARLNSIAWNYTDHCIANLKYRAVDIEAVLRFIKDLTLRAEQVFEFYADDKSQDIIKVCYRINWLKDLDIILVIGEDKQIITIYINSNSDNHETLKKELYING